MSFEQANTRDAAAESASVELGIVPRSRCMRSRAQSLRELAADQPRIVAEAFERRARQLEAGARLVEVILLARQASGRPPIPASASDPDVAPVGGRSSAA